jgi:hypothetical protein
MLLNAVALNRDRLCASRLTMVAGSRREALQHATVAASSEVASRMFGALFMGASFVSWLLIQPGVPIPGDESPPNLPSQGVPGGSALGASSGECAGPTGDLRRAGAYVDCVTRNPLAGSLPAICRGVSLPDNLSIGMIAPTSKPRTACASWGKQTGTALGRHSDRFSRAGNRARSRSRTRTPHACTRGTALRSTHHRGSFPRP